MAIGLRGFALAGTAALATYIGLARPVEADVWSDTFTGCTKQQVEGAGLAISSYACGPDHGKVHLEADATLPGFVELQDTEQGILREPKIRIFKKDPAAPIEAILEQVRAASPGPASASCILEKAPPAEGVAADRYYFAPTGEAKAAWDRAQDGGPEADPPCGSLGVQFVGDLYFVVLNGDPGRVAFIDAGSEIQIFDPSTLRAAP